MARLQGDVAAFRNGLLSSSLSSVLKWRLDHEAIQPQSTSLLLKGVELIDQILQAQELLARGEQRLQGGQAPNLDAYRCSLHLVLGRKEEFDVKTRQDLQDLFERIKTTLKRLAEGADTDDKDVKPCFSFFDRFAELMVSEVTTLDHPVRQLLPTR